jgi:hypothetical protein
MRFSSVLPLAFACSAVAVAVPSPKASSWPYGPLVTEGRWIRNTKNEIVTPVGVNWPGHGEAMIPEGLQYASITKVLKDIKSLSKTQNMKIAERC